MHLGQLLDQLLLQPLLQIYDSVLTQIMAVVPGWGWALMLFSLVLNLALLPLYYQMERAGQKGASARERMRAEIDRIKAHYRGRERYFYVRAVHRQFGYRPISAVFNSADLYLQILVFATVYRFISAQEALRGARFLFIGDLGSPDGLLLGVNLLPLLMTLFNIGSALYYGGDRGKRRNALLLAGLFLVLLYNSPAGLVLYWTCNNAFSLLRNLVQRKLVPRLSPRLKRSVSAAMSQE